MTTLERPIPTTRSDQKKSSGQPVVVLLVLLVAVVVSVAVGCAVGELAGGRAPVAACLVPVVLVPIAIWKRPVLGFYTILAGTAVVEQFTYTVGPRNGAITDRIPFFHSVSPGIGVTAAEVLLFFTCVVYGLQQIRDRQPILPRSRLARCIAVFLVVVLVYLVVGLAHHGSFKIAMWEIRPWFYLAGMYVLGSAFVTTKRSLMTVLWIYVLGTGAKALYGVEIWLSIRHVSPRPEAILAHEESFFFGLFVVITIGLWIFSIKGRLRTTATMLLPFVLLADMANTRRTAWAILGACLLIVFAVAYARLPDRRQTLRRIAFVSVAVAAVYVPAQWNHDGTLAQPVRALRSQIAPDTRDEQSDQYRQAEDANLELNIRASRSLGAGFGRPIDYALPIVNLESIDAFIAYIPHDGVLYVWMRMGVIGELAFLAVIGSAVLAAGTLTKDRDPLMGLLGTVVTCAVVAYVIMGAQDMGFFWFRIALCVGGLLGAVEAAGRETRTPTDREVRVS